jgi:hypothetical protein
MPMVCLKIAVIKNHPRMCEHSFCIFNRRIMGEKSCGWAECAHTHAMAKPYEKKTLKELLDMLFE